MGWFLALSIEILIFSVIGMFGWYLLTCDDIPKFEQDERYLDEDIDMWEDM